MVIKMKKTLLLTMVLALAFSAKASYLIWQVNSSDASSIDGWNAAIVYEVSGATSESITAWNGNKIDPMSGANAVGDNHLVTGTTLGSNIGSPVATMPAGVSVAADITDISGGNGYAYYIELVNYDFSANTINRVYARSDAQSYTSLSGSITDSLSITTIANVTPWHGGNYSAVPEPTSGLMLLLGAAMLGLRRKNRSVA